MKKLLSHEKGFTFLELMVVMTIIAILAVVGISLYSTIQMNARDLKRKSEINSIAKSIEVYKNYTTKMYSYSFAKMQKDFLSGAPFKDDIKNTGSDALRHHYCIAVKTAASTNPRTPPDSLSTNDFNSSCHNIPPGTYWSLYYATCEPGDPSYDGLDCSTQHASGETMTLSDVISWTLCAKLEVGNLPYCVKSLTQ